MVINNIVIHIIRPKMTLLQSTSFNIPSTCMHNAKQSLTVQSVWPM